MADIETRVEILMERVNELGVAHGRLEERVASLEEWQVKQNGALEKVEGRLDRKWESINNRLIGLMGAVIVQLLMLVLNILVRR